MFVILSYTTVLSPLNLWSQQLPRLRPNLGHHPGIFLDGLRKNIETLCHDARSLDPDCNTQPNEQETGVPTIRPRRSVLRPIFFKFLYCCLCEFRNIKQLRYYNLRQETDRRVNRICNL